MCPSRGSNLQVLAYEMTFQPTEPPGQGVEKCDGINMCNLKTQHHLNNFAFMVFWGHMAMWSSFLTLKALTFPPKAYSFVQLLY